LKVEAFDETFDNPDKQTRKQKKNPTKLLTTLINNHNTLKIETFNKLNESLK
jgi:hypothetical protein